MITELLKPYNGKLSCVNKESQNYNYPVTVTLK